MHLCWKQRKNYEKCHLPMHYQCHSGMWHLYHWQTNEEWCQWIPFLWFCNVIHFQVTLSWSMSKPNTNPHHTPWKWRYHLHDENMCLIYHWRLSNHFWELGLPIVYLYYLPPCIPTYVWWPLKYPIKMKGDGSWSMSCRSVGLKLKWLWGGK